MSGRLASVAILDNVYNRDELRLVQWLDLPVVSVSHAHRFDFVLGFRDGYLMLCDAQNTRSRPLFVDLNKILAHSYPTPKKGPMAVAVGRRNVSIVDATAGLGGDTLLLFAMGYQVTAVERSPVLAALLIDGLRRLTDKVRIARSKLTAPRIVIRDAREFLTSLTIRPDCIYLDPMFPPKHKRSALARKEVRVLRRLVGDDEDAAELLQIALQVTNNRVVVKRADDAPALELQPDVAHHGRTVRYDVYLKH